MTGSRDALQAWSGWASSVIHGPRLEPDHGPRYYKPDRGPRPGADPESHSLELSGVWSGRGAGGGVGLSFGGQSKDWPSYHDLPGRIPSSGGDTGQGDGETDGSAAGSSLAVQ